MVYYYILNSTLLGEVTLQDDPVGWEVADKTLSRDLKGYMVGVMRKRTADLRFFGDGLDYLTTLFDGGKTEEVVDITIYRKVDYKDAVALDFKGIGKLNPFSIEYEDEKPYVKISFEDSQFHNKLITRDDVEINTGLTESIDGLAFGAIPTQAIQIKQREIVEINTFGLNEGLNNFAGNFGGPVMGYVESDGGFILPAQKIEGETESVNTPADYSPTGGANSTFLPITAQGARIKINFNVQLLAASLGNGTLVLRIYTGDYGTFVDTVIETLTTDSYPTQEPWNITYDNEITLEGNQGFSIFFLYASSYTANVSAVSMSVEIVRYFDELQTDCHWRYDYMKRLCQIITDQEDCIKSSVFGRTVHGYSSNGKFSDHVVMSGLQIRGFQSPPITTLKSTAMSIRSIWNVGFGVEKVGSIYKVVIEEMPYFFRGDISTTLYGVSKVKREVLEDLTTSAVHVGYKKAEYEQVNGLEEYNNLYRFATYIKSVKGVLELVSDERADTTGMEYARRKHKLYAASEDTRYDEDTFISMVHEVDGILVSQLGENYDSVLNIPSPATAGNLDITPQRNLLRCSDWIRACLEKYPTEYLKFVSADKATDLVSTKTGESAVAEQTNVQNSNLLSPLWLNLTDSFECALSSEQLLAMENKPYSLVKWSPYSRELTQKFFYGWILQVKGGAADRKGQCKLLVPNLSSERLVIIDPEGLPEPPVPPIPPQDDEGGLEVTMEGGLDG